VGIGVKLGLFMKKAVPIIFILSGYYIFKKLSYVKSNSMSWPKSPLPERGASTISQTALLTQAGPISVVSHCLLAIFYDERIK